MKSRHSLLLVVAAAFFIIVARYALGPSFSFNNVLCAKYPFEPAPARPRPASVPPFSAARGDAADCAFLNGTEAAVFFHAWPNNGWRAIVDDVVATLQTAPLAACGVPTFVGFPSSVAWPYEGADELIRRATFPAAAASRPHNEPVTLAALAEWCSAAPSSRIAIYIHDKGVRRHMREINSYLREWDWRKLHEYFLVERPQGCFRALTSGADACGVNRMQAKSGGYFLGNFWAARCDYIAALPAPLDYVYETDPFMSPEVWIGALPAAASATRKRPPHLFNCYNSGIHHYVNEFSRAIYVGENCSVDAPDNFLP
jgi:hypothetical protein